MSNTRILESLVFRLSFLVRIFYLILVFIMTSLIFVGLLVSFFFTLIYHLFYQCQLLVF